MPLTIGTLEGRVDIPLLIEDLAATLPLYRATAGNAGAVHPTAAALRTLGEAWLDTGPQGLAQEIPRAPGFATVVDSFLVPVLGGTVRLSYFLMALILGRPGLRAHFRRPGGFDWSGCLRWLVLHGVREMDLWPYLSDGFVRDLRAPSLLVEGKRLTPLQALVMAERPDVLAAFREAAEPGQFAGFFDRWFVGHGAAEYGHVWLLTEAEAARKIRQDPGGTWAAAPDAAADDRKALDAARFPEEPADPPSPASLARPPGQTRYRLYGADYPYAFLDMAASGAAPGALISGEARPGQRGGIDLLSAFTEIRLPGGRNTPALLRLDLAVPEPLRPELSVRVRVRDGLGAVRFERRLAASAFAAGPLVVPVILRDLSPRLEIGFALDGRPPAAGGEVATTFAVLRGLGVWQVIADAERAPA